MPEDSTYDPVIKAITLRVRDLERSVSFYADVLGLDRREQEPSTAALGVPGSDEPIVRLIEDAQARPKPPRALGLFHVALLVPDRDSLGAVLQRLVERGIRLQGASDHAVSEALYLADPDGHGLEIYRDRPSDEWTHTASGELYMTTKPLDLGDVAAAAREPSGLPSGTTIGHIHLHVSSLEKAEAFYGEELGFDVTVRSYPGALFMSTDGYHHHIGLNTWAGPHAEKPDDRTIGMIFFAMKPPKRLADAGELVVDPDGIRIRLAG